MKFNHLKRKATIGTFVFFSCFWLITNSYYLGSEYKPNGLSYSLLTHVSGNSEGYLSFKNLFVYYIIPFLFIIPYFVQQEDAHILIRYRSRKQVHAKRSIQVFQSALMFSFCILLINCTGVFCFDYNNFTITQYWIPSILNLGILVFVYSWVGMFYLIVQDYFGRIPSILVIFLLCSILGFGYRYFSFVWTPSADTNIIDGLIFGRTGLIQVLIVHVREAMIMLIFLLMGFISIEKKDFCLRKSR